MKPYPREHDHAFRLLVEGVIDYAIFLLSPEGIVLTWNTGAQRITGYSADEIIGKHYSIFFPPMELDNDLPVTELEIALSDGRFEQEGWRVRKNGERFAANVVVTRLFDESGRHVGFAKVVRDLSERRYLQDALQMSEETFRLLVEGTEDYAIFMLDQQGYIQSWNRGVQRIKGYSAAEVLGKHFSIFYPEEDLRDKKPERELVIATEVGHYQEEGWRVRKDGTQFWASVLITALRDSRGKLRGFSKVTRDLTERRRAEEALRQRSRELEVANQSLEEFAYSVSHDLRAPLRALQGFSQALLEDCYDQLDETGQEYAGAIHQGAADMDKLIHDLLTYSRLGIANLKLGPVNLDQLVSEIVEAADRQIQETGSSVQVLNPLPVVTANRVVLSQVITNLLSNALKFTDKSQSAEVTLRAEAVGPVARLFVEDRGIGIEPEYQQRIFKVFERLHGGESYPGTGIGLAIVARGVERMGGALGLTQREGGGSSFWIELPLWTEV